MLLATCKSFMLTPVMESSPSISLGMAGRCAALLGFVLITLGVGRPAHASCFAVRAPDFVKLRPLVSQDASDALVKVSTLIDRLPPGTARTDPRRLAALYAVRSAAYGELTLYQAAREAALQGMKLLDAPTDPLRLELLSNYALSFSSPAAIDRALRLIKQARASLHPGSRSNVCLQITSGELNMLRDRSGLAIRDLTEAYMQAHALGLTDARVDAGEFLSVVLRSMGDYNDALAFIQKSIRWDTTHKATEDLASDVYFEGEILRSMRRFPEAIAAYRKARALNASISDHQAVAYSDLRICQTDIALKRFAAARRACTRAAPVLAAGRADAMVKETDVLIARIDLAESHPRRALALLNGVLNHHGADMLVYTVAPAYLARSQANAALHQYAAAFRDQSEYLRRYQAHNRISRVRLRDGLETRFQATQEFKRNEMLTRRLHAIAHRAAKQREILHWMEAAGIAGGSAILLLSYILIADRRHRHQLLLLANEDPLTRLPNRGHTAQLAAAALASALDRNRSFAVALIDFDYFKAINDQFGHAAGDHVLREFADLSRGALRVTDILGRWGGEEFLLVLPDATLESALATIERLRLLVLGIQIPSDDPPAEMPRVSFSAGVTTAAEGGRTLDEIVARADVALYEAKDAGRGAVHVSGDDVTGAARARSAQAC